MHTLDRWVNAAGGIVRHAEESATDPWNGHDTLVIIATIIGIALVVVLIVWAKFHAFLALTIASLFVGLVSGISVEKVTGSYETGVGGVLGYVGVLIALGAILGKLLADSGGADQVVDTLLRGRPATLPWKMALIAGIIGIPMFFEIGLVLLIPVVMLAVSRSNSKAMRLGIPALAGLSVLHGFIPPHPGPLAAIGVLGANVGTTLAFGLIVAIPTVIIAGPLFGQLAARMVPVGAGGAAIAVTGGGGSGKEPEKVEAENLSTTTTLAQDPGATRRPSFTWTLVTILSPVVLMLAKAAADLWVPDGSVLRQVLDFIGDPVTALLIAVLLAMVTFGTAVGFSLPALGKKVGESLLPIVGVVFIVGAGGGFKQVLVDGGAGTAIAKIAVATSLSVVLLGWIIAVLIRLATGSATVATVTAAGIIAPLAADLGPAHLALLVLAVGAGSLFFSHVNDAGFWLVKEYFGLTVGQTIKTWSIMETLISVVGFLMVLLLWAFTG
ncbi:gluconate:H+ symporter [Microbacterium horticulturae]|uniref:Gluconate:H+ symporter n=1 Tax=Microbacterium horticulturae TaxID=3028316 RepID=A0ABY8BXM3_9MICO|nr:gluconate:H+ symporter [Microbacterium sp. KACC 23027]WEG08914.1 gluconate:H+ symporter [Microbacterium sp. KACC 23027]